MATFKLTPGIDNFTGTAGQSNLFEFTTADLQSTDTVTGVAGGPFVDILALTQPGTVTGTQFAGVTNMEGLNLPGNTGTNNVTLTNGLVSGSSLPYFTINGFDHASNDTVDGSAVTSKTLIFYGGAGNDTLKGGSGDNYFVFHPTTLDQFDTIVGGAAFDSISFLSSNVAFASNLLNIETIDFAATGDALTLDGVLGAGSLLGHLRVNGSDGADTVTLVPGASGTLVVSYKGGVDQFFGGGTGSSYLLFDNDELTSADTVTGAAGFDVVQFETAGAVAATAFNNVTNVEAVFLNAGGNSLTLNESTVSGSTLGHFVVAGGAGNDNLNATGVTSETMHFYAGTGNDTFLGGGGVDVLQIDAAELSASDTFDGNGGINYLQFISGGLVGAPALAGISDITFLGLSGGGGVILANTLSSTRLFVTGSAAGDTFSGVSVTNYEIDFYGFGGGDALIGGTKNDFFHIQDTAFTTIDGGGGGIDYLIPTQDNLTLDITANASKIDNLEVIWLDQAANVTVSLTNTDIPQLNAVGNFLYIVGGADDDLTVGDTWTVIDINHTNAAVAPGVTFTQYHNATTNSDLFIDNDIALTISTGAPNTPPTVVSEDILTGEDFNVEICNTVFGDAEAEESGANVQATFNVGIGSIVAYDATGAITVGGSGTSTLTLTGTIAEINAFVADDLITYVPPSNISGNVALTISISDLDPSGAQTAQTTQTITIAPETDGPVVRTGTFDIQRTIGTEPANVSGDEVFAAVVDSTGTDVRFDGGEHTDQSNVHTAALPDGGFVMVWQDGPNIYGQVFGQNGDPESFGPFLVDATVGQTDLTPSVAVLEDGRFVVTWATIDFGAVGGTPVEVNGRIFLAGAAMGDAFNVASFTMGDTFAPVPEVAALLGGGFIVTWAQNQMPGAEDSSLLFTRTYDSNGNADVAVERFVVDGQILNTEVVGRANGGFALGWEAIPDPSGLPERSVQFATYNAAGNLVAGINVPDGTSNFDRAPELAAFADGSVIAIWSDQQGSTTDLMALRFDGTGALITPDPFRLVGSDDPLDVNEFGATATVLDDGGLAVSWLTPTISSNSNDVFTWVFNADLTERTLQPTQLTTDIGQRIDESSLASATLTDGRYLLSWIKPDTDVFGAPDPENSGTGDDILYNIFEPGSEDVATQDSGRDITLPTTIFRIDTNGAAPNSEIIQRIVVDFVPEGYSLQHGHFDATGQYSSPESLDPTDWVIDRASGNADEIAFLDALAADPENTHLVLVADADAPFYSFVSVEVRATTIETQTLLEHTSRGLDVAVPLFPTESIAWLV